LRAGRGSRSTCRGPANVESHRRGEDVLVLSGGALALAGGAFAASLALQAAAKTFGDGTYRVGSDVPPGTYRTRGGSGCYWERLRSFSGTLNAIIANENAAGPTIVTIGRRDKGFTTARCGRWTSNLARITKSTTRFGPGKYIVGVDIAPGTYRGHNTGGCYWERLRSFSGTLSAVIANDNPAGAPIVAISRSDRGFNSARCGTWSRF
jgi:hypothetical protein